MPVNIIKNKVDGLKVTALKDARIENYEKTAEYPFYLGISYGEQGMYKEAIEAYKQSIRISPDYAATHYNLGLNYGKLGMYKEAIEASKQAIRINPDYAMAHNNLGIFCLLIGNKEKALQEYKILKTLDPEKAEKLFKLIYP